MCLNYFESIRVENGNVMNLGYHQNRVSKCSKISLFEIVNTLSFELNHTYKLRISFNENDVLDVVCDKYNPKIINTLSIVDGGDIDYSFKYNNRDSLNKLYDKRGNCDDILIVKDGYITDSSFCNIIFFDGSKWFTSKTPLLKGTCRERLITEGVVSEVDIKVEHLANYNRFMLINAMLDFDISRALPISNISV